MKTLAPSLAHTLLARQSRLVTGLTASAAGQTAPPGAVFGALGQNEYKDHITVALRWHAFGRPPLLKPRQGAGLLGANMHGVQLWPHEVSPAHGGSGRHFKHLQLSAAACLASPAKS